jgi:hypothetical protein
VDRLGDDLRIVLSTSSKDFESSRRSAYLTLPFLSEFTQPVVPMYDPLKLILNFLSKVASVKTISAIHEENLSRTVRDA